MEHWRGGVAWLAATVAAWASGAVAQTGAGGPTAEISPVVVVAPAPLPSAVGAPRDRLPYFSRSPSGEDLTRSQGRADLPGTLERELGSVSHHDSQGNPFQPDLLFRGFTASPLVGTPQGLAVYQDGVRINEAFGDTVNWDLIPENAIERVELLGSNPVFGLNAIGGALALRMKDGFTAAPGARLQALGGSFGRHSAAGEYGVRLGDFAAYVAAEGLNEDGWRRNSPSRLRRLYADLGFRRDGAELHLSLTAGRSLLGGTGTVPIELLAQDRRTAFTYPDRTVDDLAMLNARAGYSIMDGISIQASAYARRFRQRTLNADIAEFGACEEGGTAGLLCAEDGTLLLGRNGALIPDQLGGYGPGVVNRTRTATLGTGGGAQITSTLPVFAGAIPSSRAWPSTTPGPISPPAPNWARWRQTARSSAWGRRSTSRAARSHRFRCVRPIPIGDSTPPTRWRSRIAWQ